MDSQRREAGQRLRAFVHARKGERTMDELAHDAGLRGRQTLNEWFTGRRDVYLGSLEQLATALDVRRVDLVAAYDGVIAPEQQETPPPRWAGEMEARIVSELVANREALYEALAQELVSAQLARVGLPDEQHNGTPDQPQAAAARPPAPRG